MINEVTNTKILEEYLKGWVESMKKEFKKGIR